MRGIYVDHSNCMHSAELRLLSGSELAYMYDRETPKLREKNVELTLSARNTLLQMQKAQRNDPLRLSVLSRDVVVAGSGHAGPRRVQPAQRAPREACTTEGGR